MTQEPMEHRNAGHSIVGKHKEAPDPGHMLLGGHWQLWETMQCLQFSKKEKKKNGLGSLAATLGPAPHGKPMVS